MLLAIDVGNTQTVLGIFEGDDLVRMWRVATREKSSSDEVRTLLYSLFSADGVSVADVHGAVLATVVPSQHALWSRICKTAFGVDLVSVDADLVQGVLDMSAYLSTGVGADRLANAAAAKHLYGCPVISVDFGTATDMEVVDGEGRFLGGVIAPGLETSMRSLFMGTALLPAIELKDPGTAIGMDTVSSIQVGVVAGEVERIDGLVRRIWAQLGCKTPVVATGGLATVIGPLCHTVTAVDSELTLQGLRLVFENRPK